MRTIHPRLLLLYLFLTIPLAIAFSQEAKNKGLEAITKQAVQGQLEFLSSDWTEGRATGQPGAYMAADYIASMFKVYGLQAAGDIETIRPSRAERMMGKKPSSIRSYYQSFNLIEYKAGDVQELALLSQSAEGSRSISFAYKTDFSVSASDVAVDHALPLVFVGYGFTHEKSAYDDFKGVDVKDKIILRLSQYPGHGDKSSKAYETFNPDGNLSSRQVNRDKNRRAAELGAAAIIEFNPDEDVMKQWAANIPMRYNSRNYEGDVPRSSYYETRMKQPGEDLSGSPVHISISGRVLNELIKDTGIDPEKFAAQVKNSLKPASEIIPGKLIKLKTTVDSKLIRARNVVGVLPGKDTSEIIVVGGHYDHLGKHDGWIWNGADDNASGTVGVMTLARACMATGEKPEKTIVFAAWTGEEKGLLGSEYFAAHPYNDAHMILNLNYDMISRDNRDDTLGIKCSMTYTKKYSILEELALQNNEVYQLGLQIRFRPSETPRGGSDHTPFAQKGVPIFYFMAGFPPEYHQPDDHISLVNLDKMVKIIKLGYLNIWDLANTNWKEN